MGKEHWAAHLFKPEPLVDEPVEDNVRLIVRERPDAYYRHQRFVATVRYVHPPQKGAYVITYAYGATADAAQVRALDGYERRKSRTQSR